MSKKYLLSASAKRFTIAGLPRWAKIVLLVLTVIVGIAIAIYSWRLFVFILVITGVPALVGYLLGTFATPQRGKNKTMKKLMGPQRSRKEIEGKGILKVKPKVIYAAVIVAAIIIGGIVYGVNNHASDDVQESDTSPIATFETTPPEEIGPWYGVDENKAIQLCRWAAQAKLKNPGSAHFENLLTDNRPHGVALNGVHMYQWQSTVTADNGFGVPLTVPFSCTVYPMPNGNSRANVTLMSGN